MEGGFEMSEFGHTDAALGEGRAETMDVDEAIHEGATVDIFTDDKKVIMNRMRLLRRAQGNFTPISGKG